MLFLDTSIASGAGECQAGDQLSNPAEADMMMRIVYGLQGVGIQIGSIGIISPYRSQVSSNVPSWQPLGPSALCLNRCKDCRTCSYCLGDPIWAGAWRIEWVGAKVQHISDDRPCLRSLP